MTFCLLVLLMKPYNTLCKLIVTLEENPDDACNGGLGKMCFLKLMARQCGVLTQGSVCYLHR